MFVIVCHYPKLFDPRIQVPTLLVLNNFLQFTRLDFCFFSKKVSVYIHTNIFRIIVDKPILINNSLKQNNKILIKQNFRVIWN